jgi:hypothetical protein
MSFLDDIGHWIGNIDLGDVANYATGGPIGVGLASLGFPNPGQLFGGKSAPGMPALLAPPLPPDATDEEIRKAVLAQRRRLLLGQGVGSTFVSGPMGDPSGIATATSSAGGF